MNVKVALIVSAVVFAAPLRAEVQVSSSQVGVVADLSLSRVAQGVQGTASPYVRVNPILAQRVPLDIALFTIAHEQAHLVLGHVLDGDDEEAILAAESGSANGRRVGRRTLELAADCAAAQYIVSKSPALLATIIQRFLAMAEEHPDEEAIDGPPTLKERAEELRQCGSARKALRAG